MTTGCISPRGVKMQCPCDRRVLWHLPTGQSQNAWRDPDLLQNQELTAFLNELPDQIKKIQVYPNPAYDLLTVESVVSDSYRIEITSLKGQLVLSHEFEGISDQLDLSSFQKGVYFITISSKDFIATRKIIKLK